MDNQDILFASLMGSRNVKTIENFNLVQNELSKRVLPPLPFLPLKNDQTVKNISSLNGYDINNVWKQQTEIPESQQFFPLSFSFTESGEKWLFPYEPLITINGGFEIKKTNVARRNAKNIDPKKKFEFATGTIKERIFKKDFSITINGVLIGEKMKGSVEECFPKVQMAALFDFLTEAKSLFVYSPILEILKINKIVIEDYSFPFTKGENVQAYEIKALSDYEHSLIIKEPF
jgi:hypothetical protein